MPLTLAELVNIGTLFAFVLVAIGVLVLRRTRPDLERAFRCPGVPVVPILAVLAAVYLMLNLPAATWLRFFVWMAWASSSTSSTRRATVGWSRTRTTPVTPTARTGRSAGADTLQRDAAGGGYVMTGQLHAEGQGFESPELQARHEPRRGVSARPGVHCPDGDLGGRAEPAVVDQSRMPIASTGRGRSVPRTGSMVATQARRRRQADRGDRGRRHARHQRPGQGVREGHHRDCRDGKPDDPAEHDEGQRLDPHHSSDLAARRRRAAEGRTRATCRAPPASAC